MAAQVPHAPRGSADPNPGVIVSSPSLPSSLLIRHHNSETSRGIAMIPTAGAQEFAEPGPVDPSWLSQLEIKTLPRLPIPKLEDTLKRYVDTVQPLTSAKELETTKKLVSDFAKNEGPALHAELQQLAKEAPTSWLEGFWDAMYLEWREPSPINVNPGFLFNDDSALRKAVGLEWVQVVRATKFLHATAWFTAVLRSGRLAPDTLGAPPKQDQLCMTQYGKILGATRLPVGGRDVILVDHNAKHAVVLANNKHYTVDILTKDNQPVAATKLMQQLTAIKTDSLLPLSNGQPIANVGALTAEHRDIWSEVYPKLYEKNKETMERLQSGIIALCLDGPTKPLTPDTLAVSILHNFSNNRYFDKSLQLVVTEDGQAGINMEHSPFDGHTLIRFAGDIYSYAATVQLPAPAGPAPALAATKVTSSGASQILSDLGVAPLLWTLTPELRSAISAAELRFNKFALTCDTKVVNFKAYGSGHITSNFKISPDALVQIAFQITYYRLLGKVGSTYESVQTKRFYHGRTECLRSLTNQVFTMLKTFASPNSTPDEQIAAIKNAAAAHVDQAKRCQVNEGVDRHMWGMLQLAKQRKTRIAGYNLPAIYSDPAWGRMRTDHMSTSNCGNQSLSLFAFGPTAGDGFGLGYIIKKDNISVAVTNFNDLAAQFAELFELTLNQLSQLFLQAQALRLSGSSRSKL